MSRRPTAQIKAVLPDNFYQLLKSCLSDRHFRIQHRNLYLELKLIKARVLQGSVLGPDLYLLHIYNQPTTSYSTTASFAKDTEIMAVKESMKTLTKKTQTSVDKVAIWTGKCSIKFIEQNRHASVLQIRELRNNQFTLMARNYHMPLQQNILV